MTYVLGRHLQKIEKAKCPNNKEEENGQARIEKRMLSDKMQKNLKKY